MAQFDPEDKASWFFGPMSKDETNELFKDITEEGTFLVRESKSHKGDYVLCVREGQKISHYIVNKINTSYGLKFKIGDQTFTDIPSMLSFYQSHYLDTSPLIKPVPRHLVMARYDFPGQDEEDLSFKKGDILEILTKDEPRWWTARDKQGRVGQIPVPYITEFDGKNNNLPSRMSEERSSFSKSHDEVDNTQTPEEHPMSNIKLPRNAKVVRNRIPNVFDKLQLRLNVGETVEVLQIKADGKWWGKIGNREGYFPYTHIEFMDTDG